MANRYTDDDSKEADNATNALYNIGIIYMVGYYDYGKSYDYLLQARDIAERYHLKEHLPNIYNSIASILQTSKMSNNKVDEQEVIRLLRKGYYGSMEVKDYEGAAIALANMIQMGFSSKTALSLSKEISVYRATQTNNDKQRQ